MQSFHPYPDALPILTIILKRLGYCDVTILVTWQHCSRVAVIFRLHGQKSSVIIRYLLNL